LKRKFTSVHPEIGIKDIASNKIREKNCTISNINTNGKGQLKRVTKEIQGGE
jgi:hypothetical protein